MASGGGGGRAWANLPMASELERRRTFSSFPSMKGSVTPSALAAAGFYHAPTPGSPDQCTCFCCGLSLVQWEPTDDPWSEHRRHSPHCAFLAHAGRSSRSLGDTPGGGTGTRLVSAHAAVAALLKVPERTPSAPVSGGGDTTAGAFLRKVLSADAPRRGAEKWHCDDIPLTSRSGDWEDSPTQTAPLFPAFAPPSPKQAIAAEPPPPEPAPEPALPPVTVEPVATGRTEPSSGESPVPAAAGEGVGATYDDVSALRMGRAKPRARAPSAGGEGLGGGPGRPEPEGRERPVARSPRALGRTAAAAAR
eukprot:Hpha_TRINITY_DN16787_c2_g3::TRINITY_DN16787_c2_g3_i2::g.76148::m.76148